MGRISLDARVYHEAVGIDSEDPLVIPPGSYLLADGGYPLRGTFNPLSQHALSSCRMGKSIISKSNVIAVLSILTSNFYYFFSPNSKEELFNLQHTKARNVIERIFGALKRRFRILSFGCEYSMDVQPKILSALSAIHNFIHIHNPQVEANEAQADLDDDNDDLHGNAGDYMVQGIGYVFVDEVEDGDVAA